MHVANRILRPFGIQLARAHRVPRSFRSHYARDLATLRASPNGFQVLEELLYDAGDHPLDWTDHECEFAANELAAVRPERILDVGSYRKFVTGVAAAHRITTVDVRGRPAALANETVVTGDARGLPIPDESFDAVTSLCALEHFGLGRYGDAFDLQGDRKALAEMVRVLRPGGSLILTTTITRGPPTIVFNAHRIYTRELLRSLAVGLETVVERYFSMSQEAFVPYESVTNRPGELDLFLVRWRKPAAMKRTPRLSPPRRNP